MNEKLIKRFLSYVKQDTKSDPESFSIPSSPKIRTFAENLYRELKELGMDDVYIDDKSYIYACLKKNCEKKIDTIGFIAHMDTAPDMSGENVKPTIIENYDGKDIVLNEKENITMHVHDFPELMKFKGQSLIVTDGLTLLGADDKAGIAEIVSALEYFIEHKEIEHGDIKIAFTPDEEIGRGADHFDVERFGADYAYTMDGGDLGELEYENFNAASVKVKIKGRNVHPGSAKNKMINSQLIAMEFNSMLPENERPEYTEKYEGFILLTSMKGQVEDSELDYIIRDFTKEGFAAKKCLMKDAADFLNYKYSNVVDIDIKDSYYNMREKLENNMNIVKLAKKAMENIGIKPQIQAIRGGTDGARLSFMGLPCPNIFAGGLNFHGRYEYLPIENMQKAYETIIEIVKLSTQNVDFK